VRDVAELASALMALDTTSGTAEPQRRAMAMVIDAVQQVEPSVRVTGDLAGRHPWCMLTSDAPPDRRRLLFACHVDTVPVGDPSRWSFDPLAARVDDGVLLGRGASDMKGGIAAAVGAFMTAAAQGQPVALLLTSDEEIGSLGARAAAPAMAEASIGAVIVPEATGRGVHLGHRGALWLEIRTTGRAAHGSTPELGHNAALDLVSVLQRAGTALPLADETFLGTESWNLGVLTAGTVPNVVPDTALALVDHRVVADGRHLRRWWSDQPEVGSVRDVIALPAVSTSPDDAWVDSLDAPISTRPVSYFTDGSVLAGATSAPVVIWGPGSPGRMHAADEQVSVSELELCAVDFTRAALAWGRGSAELRTGSER